MQGPSEHGPGPARADSRRGVWLLVGLLLVLSLARVWKLEIDPPRSVVRGYWAQAHYRDEAAKAHEARNKAKWDQWSLSEADEYGFWRAQSPAWVWGEYLWFRAFGVGLAQARLFVVTHTIIALALLMWLAWVRHGLPAALASGLLLGLNWPYLVYSRLALMEGALLCWLLVASVALSELERRPRQAGRWSVLACVAMLIACTIKQTGLLVVPAFAVVLLVLGLRAAGIVAGLDDAALGWKARLRARLRLREAQLALLSVTLLGLVLIMLVLSPDYQQRLAFNAAHFTAARENPVLPRAAATLARGLFSIRLQLMFFALAPMIMWLGTLDLVRVSWLGLRRAWARRKRRPMPEAHGLLEGPADIIDWWMLAWGVLGLLANLASPHRAIRFQLIILPPAAWLAAAVIARAWLHTWPSPRWTKLVRGGLLTLVVIGVFSTTMRMVRWMRDSEATAAYIGDELQALIGEREAVVVGEFAAQAVFETDYRHFYVRPYQFNDRAEVLSQLGITHLAITGESDFVESKLREQVPELLFGRRRLGTVRFRDDVLVVWELPTPERRAELEAWQAERDLAEQKIQEAEARRKQQQAAKRKRAERAAAQCLPDPLPEPVPEPLTRAPLGWLAKPAAAVVQLDGAQLDGAQLDGAQRDGAQPDGAQRDGAQPDGAQPDGAQPDGAQPDGLGPGGPRRGRPGLMPPQPVP